MGEPLGCDCLQQRLERGQLVQRSCLVRFRDIGRPKVILVRHGHSSRERHVGDPALGTLRRSDTRPDVLTLQDLDLVPAVQFAPCMAEGIVRPIEQRNPVVSN